MAEIKTVPTGASVSQFINGIDDDQRRKDCKAMVGMMEKATKSKARMFGDAIVGFGTLTYFNSAKKPQPWFECGFSPRKQALTLYLMGGFPKNDAAVAKKLGKFKIGGGCVYIKSLDDVHLPTLRTVIAGSLKRLKTKKAERGWT
jgi:hypothetical protein